MTDTATSPSFEEPELACAVEQLAPEAINALPFGAIHLDTQGVVIFYSDAERRLSGSGDRARLGHDFFADIAPCMDTDEFRGRIERAHAQGTVDLEFGYVGDFADRARELAVRIQSASDGGVWIFMQRDED